MSSDSFTNTIAALLPAFESKISKGDNDGLVKIMIKLVSTLVLLPGGSKLAFFGVFPMILALLSIVGFAIAMVIVGKCNSVYKVEQIDLRLNKELATIYFRNSIPVDKTKGVFIEQVQHLFTDDQKKYFAELQSSLLNAKRRMIKSSKRSKWYFVFYFVSFVFGFVTVVMAITGLTKLTAMPNKAFK